MKIEQTIYMLKICGTLIPTCASEPIKTAESCADSQSETHYLGEFKCTQSTWDMGPGLEKVEDRLLLLLTSFVPGKPICQLAFKLI